MHFPIQLAFYCLSFKTSIPSKLNFTVSKDEYTLKTRVTTRELKMSRTRTRITNRCRVFTKNTQRSVKHIRMFFFCYRPKTLQCVFSKTHQCVLWRTFYVNTETPMDVFFLLQFCVLKVSHMKHLVFTVQHTFPWICDGMSPMTQGL